MEFTFYVHNRECFSLENKSVIKDITCPVCNASTFHYFDGALKADSLFPFWNQHYASRPLLLSKNMGKIPQPGRRGAEVVEALCLILPILAEKSPNAFFKLAHTSRMLYVMAQSVIKSRKG